MAQATKKQTPRSTRKASADRAMKPAPLPADANITHITVKPEQKRRGRPIKKLLPVTGVQTKLNPIAKRPLAQPTPARDPRPLVDTSLFKEVQMLKSRNQVLEQENGDHRHFYTLLTRGPLGRLTARRAAKQMPWKEF